jgi:hypothetical protein
LLPMFHGDGFSGFAQFSRGFVTQSKLDSLADSHRSLSL